MGTVEKDSLNVTRYVNLVDATAGTPETGYTITNLDLQYTRFGDAPVTKVDAQALAATDSAHANNKAIEIDSTSSPGLYRVDWPDEAFATGADGVVLVVSGSGLAPAIEVIELVDSVNVASGIVQSNVMQVNGTNQATGYNVSALVDAINTATVAIKAVTDDQADVSATMLRGTVSTADTTTSFTADDVQPGAVNQYKDRLIIFDSDTTTTNLRNASKAITAVTTGGVYTTEAFPTAPQVGDTFTIV